MDRLQRFPDGLVDFVAEVSAVFIKRKEEVKLLEVVTVLDYVDGAIVIIFSDAVG